MKCDRRRSIVWNYFKRSADNKYVKCLFCSKSMKYFRNTTNLRQHLGRKHFEQVENNDLIVENDTAEFITCELKNLEPLPVTFEIITPESPAGPSQAVVAEVEADCGKQNNTRRRSLVWNYFTKSTDGEYVTCDVCNRTFKFSSNTTNLRLHLKSSHFIELQKTETANENENAAKYITESENSEEAQSVVYEMRQSQVETNDQAEEAEIFLNIKSSKKSFVWNYFHKSADGRFVTCSLCDRILRYYRNTTNLRAHLRRWHCNEFRNECLTEENSQQREVSDHNTQEISTEATARKFKVKKSIVWNYFKRNSDGNGVVCILCRKDFKFSNTTNLKDHLNRAHPSYVRKNKLPVIKKETSYFPAPKRLWLENYNNRTTLSDQKVKEINNCLITMLVTSYQSFSLIENQPFLEYSKKLQPAYTPPNKEQLLSTTLPEFYKASVSEFKMMLDLVESVSISIDAWTVISKKSYLTITCHFIHEDKLYDYVVATKEVFNVSCMESTLSALLSTFNEWKIFDKIVTVISNDVNNIRKCMNILPISYHFCAAQMLNAAVSDALVADENLFDLLEKCKEVVNFFKYTPAVSEKLESVQQQMNLPLLKVKVDKGTWHSQYFMIKRLLMIRDPLCVALTDPSRVPYFLDTFEWDAISDCFSLLEPFELMVIELLYEKYPTMSLMIPLIRGLHYSINSKTTQSEIGVLLKERLLSLTNYYLNCLESNKIAACATFLDPRFKTLAFGNDSIVECVQKWISEELLQIMTTNDASDSTSAQDQSTDSSFIWAYFDTKIAQRKCSATPSTTAMSMINQYLEMSNLERNKNWLEFWNDHKTVFPELYQIAMKYLSVPATAVPPERLFSPRGRLSDTFRSCLPSKNLDQIIFLNSYLNRHESPSSREEVETLPNTDTDHEYAKDAK